MKLVNSDGGRMKTNMVQQNQMSEECWLIQMWGKSSCRGCEVEGTEECGGKRIRRTGKNNKGFTVPLGQVREEGEHEYESQ